MHNFWTVVKLELTLIWRNWAIWLIAFAVIVIGVLAADNNLNQPWGVWGQFISISLFLSLILTFSTGNQVNRDRERRLDGVIFSTPVATPVYVLAKYSAALLSLLGLAGISLLAAILTDQFYHVPQRVFFLSPVVYPPLGPQVYLLGWIWLLLAPMIFGATFMFVCTTLTRGKRVVAYIVAFLAWLIPVFTLHSFDQKFFDITAQSFTPNPDPAVDYWFRHLPGGPYTGTVPPGPSVQFIQQIMPLARADVPPASVASGLLWDRLFFLGVSVVLICLTIYGVQRMRRSA